jgi:hypothetical protein
MILIRTLKWQVRKWLIIVGVLFLVFMPFLPLLAFLPVPQEGWHNAYHVAVNNFIVPIALINLSLFSAYMMIIYPIFTAFSGLAKTSLIEHQPGNSYIYVLASRLFLNLFTFALGIGTLRLTWRVMHRFEYSQIAWVSNMLADYTFFAELVPMVGIFTVGAPLLLLIACKYFDIMFDSRSDNIVGMDPGGEMLASGLIFIGLMWNRFIIWFPFAVGVTIIIAANVFFAISAAWAIARFIDRNSEVTA